MSEESGVKCYVVVHNIAKRHNVGTLARSATAFGVSELILVGRRDFNAFGSHSSTSHLGFRHFFSLLDARNFLKERDCDICGVEITDNALPVDQHPFKRSTAFLLGNECGQDSLREPVKVTNLLWLKGLQDKQGEVSVQNLKKLLKRSGV